VQVSKEVLGAGFESEVSEVSAVRETIMGTSIRGTARMWAQISLSLVPDSERAAFDILLTGSANSTNVGRNGPVTIYSNGLTRISANKRVYVDAEGLHAFGAVARCSTRSTIHRIAANCCLVRRIAWKRARQQKGQAERIASGRAARRVEGRFDGQAAEMLGEANESFATKFRNPLLRRNGFPNLLKLSTNERRLFAEVMRAGPAQLASPNAPPPLDDEHAVAVRVHDSIVGNFSETLLGGETLTDEKLVELLEKAEVEVPEELKIGPDKDPWSITFMRKRPIHVEFSPAAIKLTIEGDRFTRGDQALNDDMRISATYVIEKTAEGISLTRQGDVDVEFTKARSLGFDELTIKTFFQKKFASLFKPEFQGTGLVLPGNWKQAGTLRVRQMDVTEGWLALGWQQDLSVPVTEQLAGVEP
jgi:hypothetical protein